MKPSFDPRYFITPRAVTSWQPTPRGVRANLGEAILEVTVLGDALLRLEVAHPGHHEAPPTHAICADLTKMTAEFHIHEVKGDIVLDTQQLRLSIGTSPFRLRAQRADGSVIFDTPESGSAPYAYLNDQFVVSRASKPTDTILGLGQKTGHLNRNGRHLTLWNTDVLNPNTVGEFTTSDPDAPENDPESTLFDPYYGSIPFFQQLDAESGYAAGFFIDNVHRAHYDFRSDSEYSIHFTGGPYVEYIFAGPSLREILHSYTHLTGRMATPPLWSLGYHHCRWFPYTQSDVLEIANTYRRKGIPCDALWIDIDYMDGYRVFTWNEKRYPDPSRMLRDLTAEGFRTVTIIDPGVKAEPGYAVYDDGKLKGVFCKTEGGADYQGQVWPGRTLFPDFVMPKARTWWGELNANHVRSGLAGIWNDMNEPATGDIPCDAMRFGNGQYSHGTYHNAYATLMAMATHEGLHKAFPNQRPFILSRASSAGIQRFAANWLGDNMSRWDHLWMSMPMTLGFGLSGQPFVGADIGGFGGKCTPELLTRWFQAAALSPFCRHHNSAGCPDQYPWSFGPEVEARCKTSLELRYRLMPYLYSAFVDASETGAPVMRPLVYQFQGDPNVRDIDDQYMLGASLLVAPVCEEGATSRKVVLPEGTWFDWAGDVAQGPLAGGQTVTVDAPLDRIPVFARGGAVVPMWSDIPSTTMGYRPLQLDLHVFVPGEDGRYDSLLVEDDGETLGYERGERLKTNLRLIREGENLALEAVTTGHTFPGFKREAFRLFVHGVGELEPVMVTPTERGFYWSMVLPILTPSPGNP